MLVAPTLDDKPQLRRLLLTKRARPHRLDAAAFVIRDAPLLPQEREQVGQKRLVGQLDLHAPASVTTVDALSF
jgi:hypothetical protein